MTSLKKMVEAYLTVDSSLMPNWDVEVIKELEEHMLAWRIINASWECDKEVAKTYNEALRFLRGETE